MGIIDNELLDQLCECVQRNWPGRGIIPGIVCWRWVLTTVYKLVQGPAG